MIVKINKTNVSLDNINIEEIINKPTGNKLQVVNGIIKVTGKSQKNEIEKLLKEKKFEVEIPDKNIKFKGKKSNFTWSYRGVLNEETEIFCDVKITELDKDLPEEWTWKIGMFQTAILNWVEIRTIKKLLIDKRVFTKEEYKDLYDKITEMDFEKMKNHLLFGKKTGFDLLDKES